MANQIMTKGQAKADLEGLGQGKPCFFSIGKSFIHGGRDLGRGVLITFPIQKGSYMQVSCNIPMDGTSEIFGGNCVVFCPLEKDFGKFCQKRAIVSLCFQ